VLVDDIDRLARGGQRHEGALPPAKKRLIGFIIDDDQAMMFGARDS
jgi:hypothetical protein